MNKYLVFITHERTLIFVLCKTQCTVSPPRACDDGNNLHLCSLHRGPLLFVYVPGHLFYSRRRQFLSYNKNVAVGTGVLVTVAVYGRVLLAILYSLRLTNTRYRKLELDNYLLYCHKPLTLPLLLKLIILLLTT